jgi:hypothetical protein
MDPRLEIVRTRYVEVIMGSSGMSPTAASESCFVADDGPGFDVRHEIQAPEDVVTVVLETDRVVGTLEDADITDVEVVCV